MKTFILQILFLVSLIQLSGTIPHLEKASNICMTSDEKKLFDMINVERRKSGKQPISYSAKLTEVAKLHVMNLQKNHKRGGKCNLHSWYADKDAKWKNCCYTSDHKNPECMWNKPMEINGYKSHGYEIAAYYSAKMDSKEAIKSWKSSKGHWDVAMNRGSWKNMRFESMGVGIHGNYAVIWFGAMPDNSGKITTCR
jgi:uncharacterized protein YkwD